MRVATLVSACLSDIYQGVSAYRNVTRPSEASRSFTGHSRTDARKQKDDGSFGEAAGYHVKSSMGADCRRTRVGSASK